ncbi:uncharacterized protein LAESUDRAFT_764740 [Laetiporus sulphureus 93-53]|uniref:Uncharacterized protein n=1 Tax=Laetiporus sulphureus 93-53 TaxID=1314785 RepID=A0A165B603_9APHY|nr:uncharacterized protein LAESUDRAFT_764740 [Laetiporus sulphureus 93-53]KZT00317.1 hypothetical protein LAESUDRAFT_764740 [Laetiporus sulphureus 93-53]
MPDTEMRSTDPRTSEQKAHPAAYSAIEKKEKGCSPLCQSIRNILFMFRKKSSDSHTRPAISEPSSLLSPSTLTRTQHSSIQNLDQHSMIKQHLAQLERGKSPSSPVHSSPTSIGSPTPMRVRNIADIGSTNACTSPASSIGAYSILDSYGGLCATSSLSAYLDRLTSEPFSPHPLSVNSDHLTSQPSTARTLTAFNEGWRLALKQFTLLDPSALDMTVILPASRYSTDDSSQNDPPTSADLPASILKEAGPQPSCRPVIRLDIDTSAWKSPVVLHDELSKAHPDLINIELQNMVKAVGQSVSHLRGQSKVDGTTIKDICLRVNQILEEIQRRPVQDVQPTDHLSSITEQLETLYMHAKMDKLIVFYENLEDGHNLSSQREEPSAEIDQQWLEVFVNHGTSHIESVTAGVQQLCTLLGDICRLLIENQSHEEQSTALHASVNGLIAAVQEDLRKNAEA